MCSTATPDGKEVSNRRSLVGNAVRGRRGGDRLKPKLLAAGRGQAKAGFDLERQTHDRIGGAIGMIRSVGIIGARG